MNSNPFRLSMLCPIFIILQMLAGIRAHAEADNRLRVQASLNNPQGTILKYDSTVGVSLDYSRKIIDHLEFGVSGRDVLLASNANLYDFSFDPAFYEDVEQFHFYAGPSVGGIIQREDTGGVTLNTSALGLGGFVGVDFSVTEQFLLCASVHYLSTVDNSSLSILSFGLGLGIAF